MPLLTITNLTTHPIAIQDPSGNSALSFTVPASGAVTDKVVTQSQLDAMEAELDKLVANSTITMKVKDDPASFADDVSAPTVANSQTKGGVPVAYLVAVPDAASADYDITLDEKIEILDVIVQKRGGAGASGNTITVKSTAAVISDVMDTNVADKAVVRALTLDDANSTIVAGGKIRVSSAKSGGNAAALVTILAVKRA